MATRTDARRPLLPEWMAAILRQRAIEGLGLALILVSLAVLAALVSFDPLDPSWSVATAGPIRNMLGLPGAYFADSVLQLIGLAGALTVPILAAWGWRILTDLTLKRPILRLALRPAGDLFRGRRHGRAADGGKLAVPDRHGRLRRRLGTGRCRRLDRPRSTAPIPTGLARRRPGRLSV